MSKEDILADVTDAEMRAEMARRAKVRAEEEKQQRAEFRELVIKHKDVLELDQEKAVPIWEAGEVPTLIDDERTFGKE